MDYGHMGQGVMATEGFAKDDYVLQYVGDLIPDSEAKKREQKYAKDPFVGSFMYFFKHNEQRWWYVSLSCMNGEPEGCNAVAPPRGASWATSNLYSC